jgi:hypothetical protein
MNDQKPPLAAFVFKSYLWVSHPQVIRGRSPLDHHPSP